MEIEKEIVFQPKRFPKQRKTRAQILRDSFNKGQTRTTKSLFSIKLLGFDKCEERVVEGDRDTENRASEALDADLEFGDGMWRIFAGFGFECEKLELNLGFVVYILMVDCE